MTEQHAVSPPLGRRSTWWPIRRTVVAELVSGGRSPRRWSHRHLVRAIETGPPVHRSRPHRQPPPRSWTARLLRRRPRRPRPEDERALHAGVRAFGASRADDGHEAVLAAAGEALSWLDVREFHLLAAGQRVRRHRHPVSRTVAGLSTSSAASEEARTSLWCVVTSEMTGLEVRRADRPGCRCRGGEPECASGTPARVRGPSGRCQCASGRGRCG